MQRLQHHLTKLILCLPSMKNFLKKALPFSVQLIFFWFSVSIMSDPFSGPGCVDMGPRSRLLWSNSVGDPGKKVDFQGYHWGQNWRRLSLNTCTPFSPLNVRPLVPPCLAFPDKVWTADLRHRMFTRGIRCQRLSISICKKSRGCRRSAEVQLYCNPHLFRGYQWNKVSFCTCLMNIQEEYIASLCLSVVYVRRQMTTITIKIQMAL